MADARLQVVIDAVDNASKQLKTVQGGIKDIGTELATVGRNMTLFGAAVTGALGLATKAAFDQQATVAKLDQALKNVGSSYGAVQKSVDSATASIERNTNFSKSQTFGAITSLVAITGNYEQAMRALQPTLDLATAKQLDLESASFVVGRALAGQLGNLDRYGISVRQDATETEILSAITKTFGGQAEAAVNPMVQLKNSMNDLAVIIGTALIPAVTEASRILRGMIAGIKELPAPIQTALPIIAGAGVAILGLGTALLFVGQAIKVVGPAIALLTNPLALVVAALGVLTVAWFANWGGMRDFHAEVINSMRERLAQYVNNAIRDINVLIGAINTGIRGLNLLNPFKDIPSIPKIKLEIVAEDAKKEFDDFSAKVTAPLRGFNDEMDKLKNTASEVVKSFGAFDATVGSVGANITSAKSAVQDASDESEKAILTLQRWFDVTKGGFGTMSDLIKAAGETMRRTGLTWEQSLRFEVVKGLNAAKMELNKLLDGLVEGPALAQAFADAGLSVGDAWAIAVKGILDGTYQAKQGIKSLTEDASKAADAVAEVFKAMVPSAGLGTQTDLDVIKNADMLPSNLFASLVESQSQQHAGGLEKLRAFQGGSQDKDVVDFIKMIAAGVRDYFRTLPGTGGIVGSPLADPRAPMPGGIGGIPNITITLDGQVVGNYLGTNAVRSEGVRSS